LFITSLFGEIFGEILPLKKDWKFVIILTVFFPLFCLIYIGLKKKIVFFFQFCDVAKVAITHNII